jgi:hypothetical protein
VKRVRAEKGKRQPCAGEGEEKMIRRGAAAPFWVREKKKLSFLGFFFLCVASSSQIFKITPLPCVCCGDQYL